MFATFDWSVVPASLPFIWQGLAYSMQLTLVAMTGGIILGTVLALLRLSGGPVLATFATVYVNTMRSIPLLMVILWFFLIIPLVTGTPMGAERSAMITFTAFEAAYYSEIMRAGIQSVSRGQVNAGYALGMTYAQTMTHVVLPQAVRNMLPVLLTQTIILFQDVSLVYAIGATDFFGAADKITQRDLRPVEMYTTVAVVYFVICFTLSRLVKWLQSRISIIR